jgi:hypothetical protein
MSNDQSGHTMTSDRVVPRRTRLVQVKEGRIDAAQRTANTRSRPKSNEKIPVIDMVFNANGGHTCGQSESFGAMIKDPGVLSLKREC